MNKTSLSGFERVPFSAAFEEKSRGVKKIKQKDYLQNGLHPIVDQGQSAIAGYCNEEEGLFEEVPAIVFGDHTRCVKYVDEPFFAGADGVKILKPKLSDNVRFWYHALRATRIENLGYSRHFKLLKQSNFRIYDQDCECSISKRFDCIMDQIEMAERQIGHLDSLVKSRFVEMFGSINQNPTEWHTLPLDEVAPVDYSSIPATGMIWQLNLDAIESESGEILIKRYIQASELQGSIGGFKANQVLYSKLRPYLNKVVLPDESGVCTTELLPLSPSPDLVNRVYLASVLRSSEFVRFASSHSNGAKMPRVDMKAFKKFEVPLPPLSLQQKFADFVHQVDKSKSIAQKQIEKLQMLYDSLAQEYFGD